jgi:hypothetical protein
MRGSVLMKVLTHFKNTVRRTKYVYSTRVAPVQYSMIEFAVGKLDVKQRVLEGNDLLSPLAVQGDGNLGHSIFSSSVSRG